MANLFSTDPGKILDFSDISAGEVFNRSVVPSANSFVADDMGLDEARQRRQRQLQEDTTRDAYASNADDEFLRDTYARKQAQPVFDAGEEINYNAPMEPSSPTPDLKPQGDLVASKLKLSNYGYDSDSSPDHNSNVLRIGHANNKLESGVSAALTRSLAKKHGLKTGDYFEAVASDGTVYKRRYDDTVPTTYKGKPLPETVDLYDLKGSNAFGGTIVGIRPLR